MSIATDNLQAAQQRALAGRPPVGAFPYLAETLRGAGMVLGRAPRFRYDLGCREHRSE